VAIQSTGISKGALAGKSAVSRRRLVPDSAITRNLLDLQILLPLRSAGAIVGAILGSKILFMTAGYVFWRWWRKQPGHQPREEDDEKGYAQRVLGEPRHPRRVHLPGRSRRGKSKSIKYGRVPFWVLIKLLLLPLPQDHAFRLTSTKTILRRDLRAGSACRHTSTPHHSTPTRPQVNRLRAGRLPTRTMSQVHTMRAVSPHSRPAIPRPSKVKNLERGDSLCRCA
jgi:hypothetical protein